MTSFVASRARLLEPCAPVEAHVAAGALALLGAEGIALLRCAPIVHVAWLAGRASGELGEDECRALREAARLRGVAPGTRARRILEAWLAKRPSEAYFTAALVTLKALLPDLPADVQEATKQDLVAYLMLLDHADLDVRARRAIVGVGRAGTMQRSRAAPRGDVTRKEVG